MIFYPLGTDCENLFLTRIQDDCGGTAFLKQCWHFQRGWSVEVKGKCSLKRKQKSIIQSDLLLR